MTLTPVEVCNAVARMHLHRSYYDKISFETFYHGRGLAPAVISMDDDGALLRPSLGVGRDVGHGAAG